MQKRSTCGSATAAELWQLLAACPALEELELSGVVGPDADVSSLPNHLPTSCTRLSIAGAAFRRLAGPDWPVLQLTGLRHLEWRRTGKLSDLTRLSVLTRLSCLEVDR